MFDIILGIIFTLLILWQLGYIGSDESRAMSIHDNIKSWVSWAKGPAEGYRSCRDCDGYRMPKNGMVVLNPFVWPYSGTPCVDDLYILNKDSGLDLGFNSGPLTHLNTPDHVELTN